MVGDRIGLGTGSLTRRRTDVPQRGHPQPLKRSLRVLDRYSGATGRDEHTVEALVAHTGREPPNPVMLNYGGSRRRIRSAAVPQDVPGG
jgi:hypothetical protein